MSAPDPADLWEFRTRVLAKALKVIQARLWSDLNPQSSTGPADLEYAMEEFDTYVRGYADVLNRTDS